MNKLSLFGLGIGSFGVPITIFSVLVFSNTGLFAFGLACIILGGTVFLTPWNPVPEPPVKSMVEGSCINIEALLEEAGVEGKALYLPPNPDHVYAFVPLESDPKPLDPTEIENAPKRVVTEIAGVRGLTVFPPGSEIVRSSNLGREMGLEPALHHVLVDFVEAAEDASAAREEGKVRVRLSGPRIDTDHPRFRRSLGSLPVSLAGNVISHTLDAPVRLAGETAREGEVEAVFEEVSEGG